MSKLIILTGKTASGKDTIKDLIIQKYPQIQRIITTTSRDHRASEQTGVDYYFISRENFQEKIKKGEFIEYVEYGGNLYGTTKHELLDKLNHHDLIWKIDPSRAGEIRDFIRGALPTQIADNLIKNIIVIYLTTSDDVILERLRKRNLPEDEIKKRMNDDLIIWQKFYDHYDYVVDNVPGKLERSVENIIKILDNHNSRTL